MSPHTSLVDFLEDSVRRRPDHVAVEDVRGGEITYAALDALSSRFRDRLCQLGVGRGDRVGLCLAKSIDAVAGILGTLKAGAAYVPVDPAAPADRSAYILADCSVRVVLVEERRAARLEEELRKLGGAPHFVVVGEPGEGGALDTALLRETGQPPAPVAATVRPEPDDLAYILYTSGSTGRPKGVMLSHRNAVSFVDWCSEVLAPTSGERFSSHAPFHFDLSILDLYVPLKHAATVVLIGPDDGKEPKRLAALIAERRLTIWYSTPSILTLLLQYGDLARFDYSALHTVLFAGEVFPVKHLRRLMTFLPRARYLNLYGPTETNVCTFYQIPGPVPEERTEPYPIGAACSHARTRAVDEEGNTVPQGAEGELCVGGPGVMQGYWNLPERNAQAFLVDVNGERWYRTGDIVREEAGGIYRYVGRRDRMVKRRGYRIELGEIEAGLYRHPAVREAAVVAVSDEETGVRIKAFLSCRDGLRPSIIDLKLFCSQVLPVSMVPDQFAFRETLPKTSTDKINYQQLVEIA